MLAITHDLIIIVIDTVVTDALTAAAGGAGGVNVDLDAVMGRFEVDPRWLRLFPQLECCPPGGDPLLDPSACLDLAEMFAECFLLAAK